MNEAAFKKLLFDRIENVNLEIAKNDIKRFIPNAEVLKIWSKDYFRELCGFLKIVN